MSSSSSQSASGPIMFGNNEPAQTVNWPLIIGVAVVGLLAAVWLFRRK